MDVQLTIDIGKISQYMMKYYMTKAEHSIPNNVCGLVNRLLQSAVENGGSTQAVLKRLMLQLLGQRAMCRQETQHLMLSSSIVECSKSFERVSLTNDNYRMQPPDEEGVVTGVSPVDAYANRNQLGKWVLPDKFHKHQNSIATMNLASFCIKFHVIKKGVNKNKIRESRRQAKELVLLFYPSRLSALPTLPNYAEYCRYSLMKYKPWSGHAKDTYGGTSDIPTAADAESIKSSWQDFISDRANKNIPEWFFQEVDNLLVEQQQPFGQHQNNQHDFQAAINPNQGKLLNNNNDKVPIEWTTALKNDGHVADVNADDSDPLHVINWSVNAEWETCDFSGHCAPISLVEEELASLLQQRLENNNVFDRPVVEYNQLNEKQRLAFDMAVTVANYDETTSSTDGGDGLSQCMMMLGLGGTGKTFVIDAIVHRIVVSALANELQEALVIVTATTAKAASLIGGSTLHNKRDGFNLPVGRQQFKDLQGSPLQQLQERFEHCKLVVIDEFSMLRAKELYYISERLKQAKGNDRIFGGLPILLSGDTGQLPAVKGVCLWESLSAMKEEDDKMGGLLYTQFLSFIIQTENRRVTASDPGSLAFCELQGRVRDAKVTEMDWQILKTRSKDSMGQAEWERQGFADNNIPQLCVQNVDVDKQNLNCLINIARPICKIEPKHTGSWLRATPDNFQGLEAMIYLCKGALIMITNNDLSNINITNGTLGIVTSIKFWEEDLNENKTLKNPCLPAYIWVDFGESYKGDTFFPNDPTRVGWVPIFPKTARYWSSATSETTQTMVSMKLAWPFTIHKAQGQTIPGKFVIRLGEREIAAGLTYVAISRAKSLQNIGFLGGLSLVRVTTGLQSVAIQKQKAHEQVLCQREALTIEKLSSIAMHNM